MVGTVIIPAYSHDLTALTLWAQICAHFFHKLHGNLIIVLNFVCWQHLIARNVHELFTSNRGISHLNEACRIDELSRGSIFWLKFSQTTSDPNVPLLLAKSRVLLVFVLFHSNSSAMAAAGVDHAMNP